MSFPDPQSVEALFWLLGFFALVCLVRYTMTIPDRPDPWDREGVDLQGFDEEETSQLCLNCTEPVVSSSQYYCKACGHCTGPFTGYLPWVNIPQIYGFMDSVWKKACSRDSALSLRIVYWCLILLTVPQMLLIGIPLRLLFALSSALRRSSGTTAK